MSKSPFTKIKVMSFFKDIVDGLRRTVGYIEDPFKVKDSYSDQYQFCNVVLREDFLVLYSKTIEGDKLLYEIVVQKVMSRASPATIYSLLRTEDKREGESMFHLLKMVLPVFVTTSPDFFTKDNLQEICNTSRKYPTWGPAHIAAYLGWSDCFKQDCFAKLINDMCPLTFVTPLLLGIKEQKLTVIQTLINMDVRLDVADKNGDNVYHYAATTSKEIIQALVFREALPIINERNADGHTPLHLACLSDNPEAVKELLRSGADVNLTGTHDGLPLQCAVESSSDHSRKRMRNSTLDLIHSFCKYKKRKFEFKALTISERCAREIIDMYPNQLHTKDMINGGTPLHWVKTPQCLEALLELGCIIDARNFQGDSALHMMVTRSRFSCMISLLSHGGNPDLKGAEGNTPLHLAVKAGDCIIVQALTVFDADPDITNDAGDTPRHIAATSSTIQNKDTILYILHAVGAKRCTGLRKNCSHGCSYNGDFNGIIPEKLSQLPIPKLYDDLLGAAAVNKALANKRDPTKKTTKRASRILCLDGGGIRGLILIQALSVLETTLGAPVMKHFDWVAGTSTGGILAIALALGKSVRECRCLYFRLKDKVFVGHRPYDPEPLEAFLQKEFGEKTVMDDIKGIKVLATAVLADRFPADLHLFRNYKSPAKILGQSDCTVFTPTLEPNAQLVWRACRASGAAPTYFRAMGRFLDGGLIANNPTLDAITEVHQRNLALQATGQEHETEDIGVVVSLGTGKIPVTPISTIDVFRPDSIWSAAKIVVGVSALGQLLVDKVTEADGRVVERAQAWCSMINVPYFRLNPPITENINLDEVDNKILVRTLWETNAYLNNRKSELDELAVLLKD